MSLFELDPFQKEAIKWIAEGHSVFVSAPTGAGKTVIAEAAIENAMSRHESVIYTAPIKALSNQKYRDFRARYGDEAVGILTGDVSINPDAAIVIMTTEIYRNSLFENSRRIERTGWVIFDEVHYLDDAERGTVWEEALLFTPPQIRILALSATVPNVQEIAEWIRSTHDRPLTVIEENHRPVPLHFLYQCQGQFFEDMNRLRKEGFHSRDVWRISNRDRRQGFRPMRALPNRLDQILKHLLQQQRLPAIYFAFGRRRTEILANEATFFDFLTEEERKQILQMFHELAEKYGLKNEPSALEMLPLIERGIAYHHAGMLPTLKEVIEQLFTSRLIKVIFTTETFALGINMPARSVIFDDLVKYYGTGFKNLTTRDFYQMAGRAGRRGIDHEGFVYVRVNPHDVSYSELQRIIYAKPEPIVSQLNATYATLLNLYKQLGRKLFEIYPRSFHHFQSSKKRRQHGLSLMESKLALLNDMGYLSGDTLSAKGEFAASVFGYELLLAEMQEENELEKLDVPGLCVLVAGLIFEPRKGDHVHLRLKPRHEKLRRTAEHHFHKIHKEERRYRIAPFTRAPHFHLSEAVEAWAQGSSFDKLFRLTGADEGELVRYLRMVIQLLRELAHAPHTSGHLKAMANKARAAINRDVVDAEKQLRV